MPTASPRATAADPASLRLQAQPSLAARVAQRLREAIVDGAFALGQMIPEEQLAAQFGVSRTPVREALNLLQLQGLVVVRPQRGSYVFEPSADDIAALADFRCVLEPHAAALAHARARRETAQALRAAIDEMESARAARDAVRYGRADTRLHEAFFEHCGNAYLQAAYATAATKIATLRTHLSAPADVLDDRGHRQHARLLSLFNAGRFDDFEALMREHVTGTRDRYVQALQARAAAAAGPGA